MALTLELTRAETRKNAMNSTAEKDTHAFARSRRTARILVVDDEDHVRSMIGATLERQGYDVQLATGGRDAMELLEHNFYDLVLTDIVM